MRLSIMFVQNNARQVIKFCSIAQMLMMPTCDKPDRPPYAAAMHLF